MGIIVVKCYTLLVDKRDCLYFDFIKLFTSILLTFWRPLKFEPVMQAPFASHSATLVII